MTIVGSVRCWTLQCSFCLFCFIQGSVDVVALFSSSIYCYNHNNHPVGSQTTRSVRLSRGRPWVVVLSSSSSSSISSSIAPQGSAATPLQKRTVGVVGPGGTMGGLVFGFLQRAGSLFGTGLRSPRCLGATADTAILLNRLLSRQFGLAYADESYIQLTNLQSISALQQRIQSYDALILGTPMQVRSRAVVGGTYDQTPNDKAWEIYWDEISAFAGMNNDDEDDSNNKMIATQIMDNILEAAQLSSSRLRHMIVIDRDGSIVPKLLNNNHKNKVPFTCVICPSKLVNARDYTYQKGVQMDLSIQSVSDSDALTSLLETANQNSSSSSMVVYRQDVAALCVQILQSLSWETSRVLFVTSSSSSSVVNNNNNKGGVFPPLTSSSKPQQPWSGNPSPRRRKRVDQEWCVNSHVLEEKLQSIIMIDS